MGEGVGRLEKSAADSLQGHPWADQNSASIIDDLRGGPVEDNSGQS